MVGMLGIDIAGVDENKVDWNAVQAGGKTFAIVRARWGTSPDSRFDEYWPAIRAAGLTRGPYYYMRHDVPADAQAESAIADLELEVGDLPPVLDIEAVEGLPPGPVVDAARTWLHIVESWLHSNYSDALLPIIYTSKRVWGLLGNPAGFEQYPLWVVDYQNFDAPRVPPPWGDAQYFLHQYKGDVKGVTGISNQADLDKFNIIKLGDKGLRVRQLQQRLVDSGEAIAVDGDFGPKTEAAVARFQAKHCLAQDGIVGCVTFARLLWER